MKNLEKKLFGRILCPTIHNVLGKKRFKYSRELDITRISESREQILEEQWGKLCTLVNYSYSHVLYYRNLFKRLGILPEDIKTREDYEKLPILTKRDITMNRANLLSDEYNMKGLRETASGGSTGTPVTFFANKSHMEYGLASAYQFWKHAGLGFGERCVVLWGEVIDAPLVPRLWVSFSRWLQRRYHFNVFEMNDEVFEKWDKRIRNLKPKALAGYHTALAAFADFYRRKNLHPPTFSLIISQSEKVTHRELIEEVFNCRMFDFYGSRETPGLACECSNGLMHQAADICYMEFVSRGHFNDAFSIVITPLTLFSMPLLRYEIGDLGAPEQKECRCGSSLPVMKLMYGRLLDTMEISSKKIHTSIFPHLLKDFPVSQYQVIQTERDCITICFKRGIYFGNATKNQIINAISAYFPAVKIKLAEVNTIEKTRLGKYRPVVTLDDYIKNKKYYDSILRKAYTNNSMS